jgi:hypothetical protein
MQTYNIGINGDDGMSGPPIIQGSTFQLPFTVTNVFSAAGVGATIRGQLRTDYTASADVPFSCAILTATADLLTCMATLDATTTAAMTPGKYVYDIEIQGEDGFVLKPLRGRALVLPEVTR